MVLLAAGQLAHRRFLSLWRLAGLRGIEESPAEVTLGALTTYSDVRRSPVLRREFPLLGEAARQTGGIATQNRGTLAGNIVNGSPAADTPPALLVYDAELELASAGGSRRVPYEHFHTGYKRMDLRPDELVRAIRLPRSQAPRASYYRKTGARRAQAISKVVLAASVRMDGGVLRDVRIALSSVAPTVMRARRAEAALEARRLSDQVVAAARAELEAEISPIDDLRSTAAYRRRVAGNLLEDFLDRIT